MIPPAQKRVTKIVTEKRWALWRNGVLAVGGKSYPKSLAMMDAALQRARLVRVTLTYPLPAGRGRE